MKRAGRNPYAQGGHNPDGATLVDTYSGVTVDLARPDHRLVKLIDIATHLSRECRFVNAPSTFYSVAEHSVLVHDIADYLLKLRRDKDKVRRIAALYHDAHEYLLLDIPSPLKPFLKEEAEGVFAEWDHAVAHAAGISEAWFDDTVVKAADEWALVIEGAELMLGSGWDWARKKMEEVGMPEGVVWRGGLLPDDAKNLFLDVALHYPMNEFSA